MNYKKDKSVFNSPTDVDITFASYSATEAHCRESFD